MWVGEWVSDVTGNIWHWWTKNKKRKVRTQERRKIQWWLPKSCAISTNIARSRTSSSGSWKCKLYVYICVRKLARQHSLSECRERQYSCNVYTSHYCLLCECVSISSTFGFHLTIAMSFQLYIHTLSSWVGSVSFLLVTFALPLIDEFADQAELLVVPPNS